MNPNMNESSLIYEHRSRIQAIEKELENRRKPDDEMQELIIRLDERIKEFNRRMGAVEKKLIAPSDYISVVKKVETHELEIEALKEDQTTMKTKITVWASTAAVGVAIAVAIVQDFISKLIFR